MITSYSCKIPWGQIPPVVSHGEQEQVWSRNTPVPTLLQMLRALGDPLLHLTQRAAPKRRRSNKYNEVSNGTLLPVCGSVMGQLGLVLAVIFPRRFAQTENPGQKKVAFLECRVRQITSYLLTQAVCDQNCSVAKRQQKD